MKRSLRLAVLAAAGLAAIAPRAALTYIELGIPVVNHPGGGAFWYERQHAQLRFEDTAGALFAHRQVGRASPEAQGWATAEQALRSSTSNWRRWDGALGARAATNTSFSRAGC